MDKLLYNRDILVARIDNLNHFEWVCKECAPLYLQVTENFVGWLENRCVDSHRKNSRLLKRALRISEKDDIEIVLEVNAATITDTYWIKNEDSTITWEEVNFKKPEFSSLALIGTYNYYRTAEKSKIRKTPELTNIGSFEKCWSVRNGEWWLYKEGNQYELFSEMFAYKLGKKLGFNMAEYQLGSKYIRPGKRYIMSKDFTQGHKYNFEPIVALTGSHPEDYRRTYDRIYNISKEAASDYVSLVFMDALIYNPDRHEYNFGLLTDSYTGEIIGLAPNFDNNMSLISRGYPPTSSRSIDLLIEDFNNLLDSGVEWGEYSKYNVLPTVNEQIIKEVIREVGIKVREKFIVEFIMSSYKAIGWNKKMTIETITKKIKAKEYPELLDNNDALQLVKDKVFYIPPELEVVHKETNPQVMIFSAAGATGKSALAKYLANKYKSIYWDLSKTSVGENTFYGKLDKVLGRKNVDSFQEQMEVGNCALIIDAFDEAEIRSGRLDIQYFLNDIIEFVRKFKFPSMILMSRSENARFLDEYLTQNKIRVEHYQIGLIDKENGKKFIEGLLARKKKKVTRTVKDTIEEEFSSITRYLGNEAKNFLGYAPVLEALTELIFQERNTINLLQNLRDGDKSDKLFEKIMKDLLNREQQKFTTQLKNQWEDKCTEKDIWEHVYSLDEQIYDTLSFVCFNELVENPFASNLPDKIRHDYEEAIKGFLPSHPFIRQKSDGSYEFSGPAFKDFSIVYSLLSNDDSLNFMAKEILQRQDKTSPLLEEFYSAMNDEDSETKALDNDVFPYIYDSCKASIRSNESTKLNIYSSGDIVISTHVGKKQKDLYLRISCEMKSPNEDPVLILPSIENAFIEFPGKIVFESISCQKEASAEITIKNSYIECNSVEFKTNNILFLSDDENQTWIKANNQIIVQRDVRINCEEENPPHLCAPNVRGNYKLRPYDSDAVLDEDAELSIFSHHIRAICIQFNFRKTRSISIIQKLFVRDPGPDSNKAKIFNFLKDEGCFTISGSDYTLNLDKMAALNISWIPKAQNDTVVYREAYIRYCDWKIKEAKF